MRNPRRFLDIRAGAEYAQVLAWIIQDFASEKRKGALKD